MFQNMVLWARWRLPSDMSPLFAYKTGIGGKIERNMISEVDMLTDTITPEEKEVTKTH